jgi:hypothetical protein
MDQDSTNELERYGRPHWDGVRFVWKTRPRRAPAPPKQTATIIDLLEHLPDNFMARKRPELRTVIDQLKRRAS